MQDDRGAFRLADGTPDYEALRAHYGEPNTNIIYNPRLTNVGETVGYQGVKVLSDRLEFPLSAAPWLLQKKAGDTLVCGTECNEEGFLRNVVDIQKTDNKIVVTTKQGEFTDVIFHGWVHFEAPMRPIDLARMGKTGAPKGTYGNINHPQETSPNESEAIEPATWKPGGEVKGTVTTNWTKFQAGFKFDVAIDGPYYNSWDDYKVLPTLRLLTCTVNSDVAVDITTQLTTSVKFGKEQEITLIPNKLYNGKILQFSIMIGIIPVVVILDMDLKLKAGVKFEAAAKLNLKQSFERTSSQGFSYDNRPTSKTHGFALINKSTFTKSATSTGSVLEGAAEASLGVELKFPLTIYGLAGPYPYVEVERLYKAKVEATQTKTECDVVALAGVFTTITGGIGGKIELPGDFWEASVDYPLVSLSFPDMTDDKNWPLKFDFAEALKEKMCPTETVVDAGPPKPPTCKCSDGTVCPDKVHTSSCPTRCVCPNGHLCPGSTTASCPVACKCPNGTTCPDGVNTSSCPAPCTCPNGSACPDGASTSSCPAPCTCPDGSACPGSTTSSCPTSCTCPNGSACPDGTSTSSCNTTCTCPNGTPCPDGTSTASCATACTCPDGSACPDGSNTSSCVNTSCVCSDGTACPNGQYTQCASCTCGGGGETCCGGGCPDFQTDRNNCGYCGKVCTEFTGDPTSQCVQGDCTCHCLDGSLCGSTNVSTCP